MVAVHNAENELVGLLALAVETNTKRLVVAGDSLCEYGTWLAADNDSGNQFIVAALDALEKKFPNAALRFLYLAAGTPLDWLDENKRWFDKCDLKKESRPLLRFDDDAELQASLKKKHSRSRLNQIKKRGAIELERVTDLNRFEAIFDTVKNFGDLRLSAVHRVAPDDDVHKKKFYLELFKANLLFVTLLKIGEEIASAHFDLQNRDSFMLGLTALSPFFAKYSPRKFHITLLCLELLKQNVHLFDLTPGGNYKDRHANGADEVHVLTIYFSKPAHRQSAAKRQTRAIARKVLSAAKIDRETIAERIYEARHKLKFLTAKTVIKKLNARIGGAKKIPREMRIYAFDVEKISGIPNPNLMNRNRIEDLLKYEPTESWHLSASAFHRLATERLSEGIHIYTKVEAGKLAHYGWMIERQEKSFISEVNQHFTMPPDSAVLFDFFTHPQARGRGFYQAALRQILHDASRIPNTRQIYIAVAADNAASRHVIEKVGFEYKCSLRG
ncbi:MAG: GNAT family N-acetyltransferase [Pyrinomonadaceae bacterium]